MERVSVQHAGGKSVVLVGRGLLEKVPGLLRDEGISSPAAVVSNSVVGPLYGRRVAEALGIGAPLELPDGEEYKLWPQVERCCSAWLGRGVHRRQSVLGIGGGVLTDTVGFAAAVYQRGISWIAAPTTLLAMVDASVGGKTGVNLAAGKNLVGCFWQPRLVLADVAALRTLPQRELRAGVAEVLKAAWIAEHGLLEAAVEALRTGADSTLWKDVVARSVRIKAGVVAADEREAGPRQALNLGHTLGHALEAVTAYRRFVHGEAVVWGLHAVARISAARGLLSSGARQRLEGALNALEPLPSISDLDSGAVLEHLGRDKKLDERGVAWVLPTDEGVLLGQRVSVDEVRAVFEAMKAES